MNVTSFKVGITEAVGEGRSPSYAKVELEVSVYPGESYEEAKKKAFAELKLAQKELQKDMADKTSSAPKESVKKPKKEEPAAPAKEPVKKPKKEEPAAPAKEEETKTSDKEEKEAPTKEAPQPKKEVPRKKKAPPKKKTTAYNREDTEHKKVVRGILNEHFAGWKEDDELKVTAKSASIALNGSDLLDGDGNILESFVEALKEKMGNGDV